MKFLITNHKNIEEKEKIHKKGLFCYDLRSSDFGENIATIEKNVLVNRIGSIITNEKISLEDKPPNNFIDYETFVSNNTEVDSIEELLSDIVKKKTRQLDDNILVLDLGYRNEQPVALVKRTTSFGKEYIIGFNYKITDNKIEWGYGYYYDDNKRKAMKDFKKVLEGGNLDGTFANHKTDKSKESEEYNKMFDINKIKDEISELLRKSEDYNDYTINYILLDKLESEKSIAIASKDYEIIEINLKSLEIGTLMEWAYSIDEDVFGELEKDKEIGYMSMECHYGIWSVIQEWYPEDIENKKGMQKYLKYCKDNKITKEVLEKETGQSDIENVMKYYKKELNKNDR